LDDPQGSQANCGEETVISGLRWSVSDQYGLLITVSGVGGDFSQTDYILVYHEIKKNGYNIMAAAVGVSYAVNESDTILICYMFSHSLCLCVWMERQWNETETKRQKEKEINDK